MRLPRNAGSDELAQAGEDSLHGQEVLVGCGNAFQEDGAVDGLVAAGSNGHEGRNDTEAGEGRHAGTNEAGKTHQHKREVEDGLPANEVRHHREGGSADGETDILAHGEEGSIGRVELGLVPDGGLDEGKREHPKLNSEVSRGSNRLWKESAYAVEEPAETGHNSEEPLVSAHTHVQESLIQQFDLGIVYIVSTGLHVGRVNNGAEGVPVPVGISLVGIVLHNDGRRNGRTRTRGVGTPHAAGVILRQLFLFLVHFGGPLTGSRASGRWLLGSGDRDGARGLSRVCGFAATRRKLARLQVIGELEAWLLS